MPDDLDLRINDLRNAARHEIERDLAEARGLRECDAALIVELKVRLEQAERQRDEWRALAEPLIAYGQEHARDLGIPLGASIVEHLLTRARACAEAERERDEAKQAGLALLDEYLDRAKTHRDMQWDADEDRAVIDRASEVFDAD